LEILQEIGSYAGLAAIVGLALLSALYFSQARDVRRLREWAGKAPERTSEPAAQAPRVAARPVPSAPGAGARTPNVLPVPTKTSAPSPAPAKAATAGAAGTVDAAPAAATPAATRVVGPPGEGSPVQGGADGNGVSQDTMAHPPPLDDGEADHEILDAELVDEPGLDDEPDLGDEISEQEISEAEISDDDEDDDAYEDDDELEYDEDTGDRPAVAASRPPAPARPVPPAPLTSSGARPGAATSAGGSILPPYERSRPGGDPGSRRTFSSRGRAAAVIGAAVLVLAAATLGGLRLAGGDDGAADRGAQNATQGAPGDGSAGADGPQPKAQSAVKPASVTVAVLNATTVQGAAQGLGDAVEGEGYELGTVSNFTDTTRAESVVLFAPDAEREAADVMRRLKIGQREPIDPSSQSLAGDASVVVLVGADKAKE